MGTALPLATTPLRLSAQIASRVSQGWSGFLLFDLQIRVSLLLEAVVRLLE
jgi:hypothetical protein